MASPKSRPRDGYPGRALSLIVAIAVALVAIMFATGYKTPHLGIDLAGGTSVTLQAEAPKGDSGAINSTSMNEAVAILNDRVNGQGVSEAEVQTEGSNTIVVTIPKGQNSQQVIQTIGTTAKLYFRPVIASALSGVPASAVSTASPSASGAPSSTAPSASSTAKTVANAPGNASPSAKTQGDAVTGDLTKATASASANASDKASAPATKAAAAGATPAAGTTPSASPKPGSTVSTANLQGTPPADVAAAFAALDCSNQEQRVDHQTATTSDAVACSQDKQAGGGYYTKYALGPVMVAGTDVSSANAGISTTNGAWQINLNFNSKGTSEFAQATTALMKNPAGSVTNQFAIVLDGQVVEAPGVNSAITGGQAQITGSFTQQQATSLANVLNYGALPLTFTTQDVTTVSPQLGGNQLQAGMLAGGIGLALVVLYSLVYYRGLGLVSIAGLGMSAVLTYSIMSLLGGTIHFALNLPAVCGAIVAIGITADSFVVYFERIRDEVRTGSSLRPAVRNAWPRARRTILVSDFVSFLAAAVLYFFTVDKVQGFAFTLGLTTLLDVVVIFLFTKPLITLLARRKFFSEGHPMSGVDPKRLGARPPIRGGRRRPAETKEA